MANLFHQIPDGICILQSGGVYKQVDLFERDGLVYAKWGSGFIGLRRNSKGTTHPKVSWMELEGVAEHYDPLGRMMLPAKLRSAA